ncbi:arsenate reductase/protein-tyrosine-phosphatase family protein [Microlunatus ginsengisoli]|uniref:Helix-turn-helix domain-containing protein n=1 Tax=Microlunatus ginsengisoli TaxID=363863 RepID=A0ABP6ZKB2_9ACTN
MSFAGETAARAAVFAALGEPVRLAVVDRLVAGDLSPGGLAGELGIGSNLLAHHLQVLEQAGVIDRVRSEGDRRRSYLRLREDNPAVWVAALSGRLPAGVDLSASRVVFVCTANSARSQLAAARWGQLSPIPAASAGTHPGPAVHPRAVSAAHRHGLRLDDASPTGLAGLLGGEELVIVVCDSAHEELDPALPRLHWSIPDPVRVDTDAAFDATIVDIDHRLHRLATLTRS